MGWISGLPHEGAGASEGEVDVVADVLFAQELLEVVALEDGFDLGVDA